MKIRVNREVPTGNIIVAEGDNGLLEFLSIGDYGKEKNIKADFLGLSDDINGVPHGDIMPLESKWVITISTQYGCSMGCGFCDVPKVGRGRNVTINDLINQVETAIRLHPEVKHTKRLNIHYARMGEPTFNEDVLWHARMFVRTDIEILLPSSLAHPVLSTMMPKNNRHLEEYLIAWCDMKNKEYNGDAGLQLSINSTNNEQREEMFGGSALTLEDVADIAGRLPAPKGRKYALNFALADGYDVNPGWLAALFDTNDFMVKITPMHRTISCKENNIDTSEGYKYYAPYKKIEEGLQAYGFDVIVFVPSIEEDVSKITCGNAILSEQNLITHE